jgi:hypothetical protein
VSGALLGGVSERNTGESFRASSDMSTGGVPSKKRQSFTAKRRRKSLPPLPLLRRALSQDRVALQQKFLCALACIDLRGEDVAF